MDLRWQGKKRTNSLSTFIIHSPPLLPGDSVIIPTRANSEHTRSTGRCLVILVVSSFSRCSEGRLAREARDGAARAAANEVTTLGVKVVGKRR